MAVKPVRSMWIKDGGDSYVMCSPFEDAVDIYDPEHGTYQYDDYVYYKAADGTIGKVYHCIHNINTPEAWNSEHWEEVTITEVLGWIKNKLYEPIAFSSLSIAANNTLLMGNTVTKLTFNYSMNKDAQFMKLSNNEISNKNQNGSYELEGTWTKDSGTKSYTMWAQDERGATATKNASFAFINNVYWGAAVLPSTINSSFITGLSDKQLSGAKARTITVDAGDGNASKRIFYAIPSRLGVCTFEVGGFVGGFSNSVLVNVKNESSSQFEEQYRVYYSDNVGLGNTTVKIT